MSSISKNRYRERIANRRDHRVLGGAKPGGYYSEDEIKRLDLPLYWNEGWLKREMGRLGSVIAVALEHGYNPSEIYRYARSYHKWNLAADKERQLEEVREAVKKRLRDGETLSANLIVREYEISKAVALRFLRELRAELSITPPSGSPTVEHPNDVTVAIVLSAELLKRLDNARFSSSRSKFIRNAVEAYLAENR